MATIVQKLFQERRDVVAFSVEPHKVRRPYRRNEIGPLMDGWRITATFAGDAVEYVRYAVMSVFGGLEIAEIPDAKAQPFRYGPERVLDLRYWTDCPVYEPQWAEFVREFAAQAV